MRLEEDIDFTTLNWVKPELDEALTCARRALEDYVEEPAEDQLLRTCKGELHQVQGTLRMVELYGAAMVVQEMERLVEALLDDQVVRIENAHSALMRGLVQMPDYLERLQSGYRDIPIVLLPLLNDLRTCRGASALDESELFRPNLGLDLPAAAPGATQPLPAAEQRQKVAALRPRFQQTLLVWFRGRVGSDVLVSMRDMLDELASWCHTLAGRRLWWITAGILDGLGEGVLDAHSNEVKRLIGRVDRCMNALAEAGESALEQGEAIEIEHRLLYYVAHAKPGSERLREVAVTYHLAQLLPDAKEVEHARGSLAGHNRELLNTVASAIKDDLLNVKDALDLFLHQAQGDVEQLSEQVEVLDRVGDTLGMLGLNVPKRVVEEQRGIIHDISTRSRGVDEDLLLDVAGALLYVEASLDDHIDRLGGNAPLAEDGGQLMPPSEARHVVAALMRETVGNISRVKGMLVAFIESPWQHSELTDAPLLLEEVTGALRMIDAERPMQLVQGISRFITNELIIDQRIPTAEQMDRLADTLASVEYYLESAREHRGGMAHLLDVAERSLSDLGYWPPPALRTTSAAPATATTTPEQSEQTESVTPELTESVRIAQGEDLSALIVGDSEQPVPQGENLDGLRLAETGDAGVATDGADDDAEDSDWIEVEEQIEQQVPVPDALAAQAGFQSVADEIDVEIREVFLDEVAEEIEKIRADLASWKQEPQDMERLRPIRRSFHTLKGSGRLVGAQVMGEFSWKIENLLNRVLDGSIKPHPGISSLVGHAIEALPALLVTLQGGEVPRVPLLAITEVADRLAEGDIEANLADMPAPRMETIKQVVKRKVRRPQQDVPSIELPADDLPTDSLTDIVFTEESESLDELADDGEAFDAAAVTDSGESLTLRALPSMDPVLIDILRSEVDQHLGNIRTSLADAGNDEVAIDEKLMRAVHTLNGAIAMVDIPELGSVLSPLESWLKRLRALDRSIPVADVDALRDSADLIEQVAEQFDAEQPVLPDSSALTARIEQLRDDLPETHMSHPLYTGIDMSEQEEVSTAPVEDQVLVEADLEETDISAVGIATAEEDEAEPDENSLEADNATELDSDQPTQPPVIDLDLGDLGDLGDLDEPGEDLAIEPPAADTPVADVVEPSEEVTQPEFVEAEPETSAIVDLTDQVDVVAAEPAPSPLGPLTPGFRFPIDEQPQGNLDIPDLDAELMDIFIEEGNDLLDHADVAMAQLRQQPDSHATLVDLQRDVHTLKGSARMAGIEPIGDLSHAMESLLEVLADDRRAVDADVVESLERGCDYLHMLVQRVTQGQALGQPVQAIAWFEALVKGPLPAPIVQEAPEPPSAPEEPVVAQEPESVTPPVAVETSEIAAQPAPAPAPRPASPQPAPPRPASAPEPAELAPRAPQEMIRVRADLIDSLVNYAGEVSIYRARLEQQVGGFRFNLVEFEQTVARLRDQLRKLEIETEAQIIARYQHEHQEQGGFDPLELDRFSQLQQYSRALAESVADLVSLQTMLDDNTRQAETLLLQQSRVNSDLQEGLMRTRMVPFDSVVPTLRRILRQAGQETGKRAQLHVAGAQGEMDRNLLEHLKASFEHMLRNCLAHGIETPEQRRQAGKPEEGRVDIHVSRDATEVVIRVSDDGGGMNRDAIRRKAIARGLMDEGAQLSDNELFGFVLESGFSTAGEVTQLAGRGVGMDVVANEIKQLGGTLKIESVQGTGTSFILRVPFTLAVTQAVLVKVGEAQFAIPMSSIQGVARFKPSELGVGDDGQPLGISYADEQYGVHDLADLLGIPGSHHDEDEQQPLLLTRGGDLHAAVHVDAVIGSREIVVKPVGAQVSSVPGIFGATIMGDGSVMLILDLAPLVRSVVALRQRAKEDAEQVQFEPELQSTEQVATNQKQHADAGLLRTVMVVDDSITMRKVSGRILERHGYEVLTAKDGLDALEKLQERVPDLMLLDIEMPRMDGYELATHMKSDERVANVPIIMITSRTGEKHRQRALDIGVDRYVGKPYQEAELVALIHELLGDDDG